MPEFPGHSEESTEVPPGGSKDHRPKCGLERGLGRYSEARNWGGVWALQKLTSYHSSAGPGSQHQHSLLAVPSELLVRNPPTNSTDQRLKKDFIASTLPGSQTETGGTVMAKKLLLP